MAKKKRKKSGTTLARLKRSRPAVARVQKGPAVPADIRVFFHSWPPQFPKDWQVKLAAQIKPSETYSAEVEGHQGFTDSARSGSAMWVAEAALLAENRRGIETMRATMRHWMSEIHANGGFVWEGSTGLRSDNPASRRKMLERADGILGRLAQGKDSAENARHALAHDYSQEECRVMLAIKYDRRFKNWDQRYVAMKAKKIKPIPGRTWFIEKLDAFARSIGVET